MNWIQLHTVALVAYYLLHIVKYFKFCAHVIYSRRSIRTFKTAKYFQLMQF